MNRPIDEKIVSMKMDNSDLVKKAAQTTSIFGKLTNALNKLPGVNLGRTVKDINDIQRAADKTDFSAMSKSLDTISSKFTVLNTMATTALVNITNRAVNAGLALSKSLGPEQVADGFREYEMKMGSIGTMLANTEWAGSTLDDVKKTLGELNDYADKTIYSFAQMTQNIGRFTSAGVRLEDSKTAIKGLGNLAAVSGSTSDQLNTAMYQMSQALASGKLTLMDWNSMVNAGMGGKKTQDALVKTAREMGKVVNLGDGFRNSIQDGWLTSEVLLETLKQFGEDESMTKAATSVRTFTQMMASLKEGIGSGWAETWEHVFGDFEEATKFWTGISESAKGFFDGMSKSRNTLVKDLADAGAIANVFQGIRNVGTAVAQVFGAIGDAFRKAFPPMGFVKITALTVQFRAFTAGLMMNRKTIDNISTVFHALFSILSAIGTVVKVVVGAIFSLIPGFGGAGSGALDLVAKISELIISFSETVEKIVTLESVSNGLKLVFGAIAVTTSFLIGIFRDLAGAVVQVWEIMSKGVSSDDGPWKSDSQVVKALLKIRDGFMSFGKTLSSVEFSMTSITGIFDKFFGVVATGWGKVKDFFFGIDDFFRGIGEGIVNNQGWILAGGGIAGLVAILIPVWNFLTGFGQIGQNFSELIENVGDTIASVKWGMYANSLLTVAIALGVMAVSLKLLQGISWTEMGPALNGLIFSLAGAVGALAVLNKFSITGTMGATLTLIGIAAAMAIMAGALKKLGGLDLDVIGKGLLSVIGMMLGLSAAVTLMSKFGKFQLGVTALQFVGIATAVLIMSHAIDKLSAIEPDALKEAVKYLGIILLELAVFLALVHKADFGIEETLGLLAIAGAINMILKSIKEINKIDPEQLKHGLKTLGIILGGIAAFTVIVSVGNLLNAGLGILAMAVAINMLLVPLQILGRTDISTLAIGIGALAGMLMSLGVAALMMQKGVVGAAAIVAMAIAVNMLMVPMKLLATLSWKQLGIALAGLAGGLLAVGGTAALLGLAAAPIILFSAALAILGLGLLAGGAGLTLFGKGLLVLSTLGVTAIGAIIAGMGTFITGLILLVPAATDLFSKIFVGFLNVITRNAPKVADAIAKLIQVIQEKIIEHMPGIIDRGADIIIAFIDGMDRNVPRIVDAAQKMIVNFIEAAAISMDKNGHRLTDATLQLIGTILKVLIDAGTDMITAFYGWIPGVKKAMGNIGEEAEKYLNESFGLDKLGEKKAEELKKGIDSKKNDVNKSGKFLAEEGKKGIESVDVEESGGFFGDGFINGITSKKWDVSKAAEGLAIAAQDGITTELDINSPSMVAYRLGEWYSVGFTSGVDSKKKAAEKSGEDLGKETAKGTEKAGKKSAKAGKTLAEKAMEAYRKKMEDLDYQLEMEEIDDKKYLKGLERLRKEYSKFPEIVRELNRKIKQENDKARQREEEAYRRVFDKRKELIDDRKYYDQLTLKEELEAWERMTQKYKEGTEERKEADREVYRLKKELNQKTIEDEQRLFDKRKQLIQNGDKSLTQELTAWQRVAKQYKVGSQQRIEAEQEVLRVKREIHDRLLEINKEYADKVAETNKRLKDGEKELTDEYNRAVDERTKSLTGFAGLFDEVTVKSDVTGQKLLNNLRGQVNTFTSWSRNIQTLSDRGLNQGLLYDLKQMGPQAASEIAALTSMTSDELVEYTRLWMEKSSLASNQAVEELEWMRYETNAKIQDLRKDTAKELDTYKDEWIAKIKEIRYGTEEEFVDIDTTMHTIGKDAIQGLIKGMSGMEIPLIEQSKKMANSIAKTIKDTLKIKSPSRITEALAEFAGQGLVNGLVNKVKDVAAGAKSLALTAKDTLNQFLQGFELPEDDNELHFKAVIDYDRLDIRKFGSLRPAVIRPDTSLTNSLVSATRSSIRQNDSKPTTVTVEKSSGNVQTEDNHKRPIIIQSLLNGRVIAEETFKDTDHLFNNRTNLEYSMRGV